MIHHDSDHPAILIVDDAAEICAIVRARFGRLGFETRSFANPARALEFLRSPFDIAGLGVIILDLNMPTMSGREFLEVRRRDLELSRIPVVIFSSESRTFGKDEYSRTEVVDKVDGRDDLVPIAVAAIARRFAASAPA